MKKLITISIIAIALTACNSAKVEEKNVVSTPEEVVAQKSIPAPKAPTITGQKTVENLPVVKDHLSLVKKTPDEVAADPNGEKFRLATPKEGAKIRDSTRIVDVSHVMVDLNMKLLTGESLPETNCVQNLHMRYTDPTGNGPVVGSYDCSKSYYYVKNPVAGNDFGVYAKLEDPSEGNMSCANIGGANMSGTGCYGALAASSVEGESLESTSVESSVAEAVNFEYVSSTVSVELLYGWTDTGKFGITFKATANTDEYLNGSAVEFAIIGGNTPGYATNLRSPISDPSDIGATYKLRKGVPRTFTFDVAVTPDVTGLYHMKIDGFRWGPVKGNENEYSSNMGAYVTEEGSLRVYRTS